MKLNMLRGLATMALIAVACVMLPAANAARPVEVVVPYAAGGFIDAVSRTMADELTRLSGTTHVVVDRPGGNSLLAIRSVIEHNDDEGHTLLVGSMGYLTTQLQSRTAPFDVKALAPIVLIGTSPSILYVRASLPVKTVHEFIEWARHNPRGVSFGTSGPLSSPHLNAQEFAAINGLNATFIPYGGSSGSMPALAGDHVDAVFDAPTSRSLVRTGKVRALMVGASEPLADWPELPTSTQVGMKGFRAGSWLGVFVPATTPVDLRNRLNAQLVEVLASSQFRQRALALGLVIGGGSPQHFQAFLEGERKKLAALMAPHRVDAN
jgi:tripartite-type tricarboxylate transporter receptor subunit TctC